MDKSIIVVHNGIIENYTALRAMLQAKGCVRASAPRRRAAAARDVLLCTPPRPRRFVFVSETDTEILAHLAQVRARAASRRTARGGCD